MVASSTMFSLALATLVFDRTGSALLSALALFGPMLAQVLGRDHPDVGRRRQPAAAHPDAAGERGGRAYLVQAALDLPVLVRVLVVLATAYVTSIGSGVRWGLLNEVLPEGAWALGRSAMNLAVGGCRCSASRSAGVLLQVLDLRAIFLLGAALMTLAVPLTWFGLGHHAPRRVGRPGLRETWRGNRLLLGRPRPAPARRAVRAQRAGGRAARPCSCPTPATTRPGSSAPGRPACSPATWSWGAGCRARGGCGRPPGCGCCSPRPSWLFALQPSVPLAAALALVASVGYAASLAQQEMLVALTPRDLTGQVLGVESSARMTFQGVGALVAGATADVLDVGVTITLLAAASLVVSLALTRPLAHAARRTLAAAGA